MRLGLYEPFKELFGAKDHSKTPLYKKVMSGALSGSIGSAIANPTDLVKIRLQAEGKLESGMGRIFCHYLYFSPIISNFSPIISKFFPLSPIFLQLFFFLLEALNFRTRIDQNRRQFWSARYYRMNMNRTKQCDIKESEV